MSGAIPGNLARQVSETLIKSKDHEIQRAFLGFFLQPVFKHAGQKEGVIVSDAVKDSPAAGAGIGPGDILLKINGRVTNVRFAEELPPMMAQTPSPQPAASEQLRLFIAIPLPDEIRREVASLSRRLQNGFQFTPCRPSWSDPETMHLTLVFLGAMEEKLAEPIGRGLNRVAAGFSPMRLEIKRLGVFPHWRNPRVLWTGIRDRSHQIESLHRALERSMEQFGYRPERKEYHPHLTLARFKSLAGVKAAEGIVINHLGFKFGPFETPRVILFKSVLHPSGARHTPLDEALLSLPPRPRQSGEVEE